MVQDTPQTPPETAPATAPEAPVTPHAPPIGSAYFDKPPLDIAPGEILVFGCLRNEAVRLPFFLDHYRALGVSRFFIIDNGSTDGGAELLQAQPDVQYFHTTGSYTGSAAGRLWMQELADHYGVGHWCLTVDVDELFTWPGAEVTSLRQLTDFLEEEGSAGVFCPFLDMYSDLPLSKTQYRAGQDFREVCSYFETDTYDLKPSGNPPFLAIKGGPRGTIFEAGDAASAAAPGPAATTRGGPMMRKVPLIRWHAGFSYIYSTHSHRFLQLSQLSGALLHFKFFDLFEELAAREAARGDRRQKQDYAAYSRSVTGDLCFYSEHSHRYGGPRDLVQLGVMAVPDAWRARVTEAIAAAEPGAGAEELAARTAQVLPRPIAGEGKMTLRSVAALWPFVANPGIARHFGTEPLRPQGQTEEFARRARGHLKLVDIHADHLLLRIPEPLQHEGLHPRLGLALMADGRPVALTPLDGTTPGLRIDPGSLAANVYRLDVDLSPVGESAEMRLHLFPRFDPEAPLALPADPRLLGPPVFAGRWGRTQREAAPGTGMDGVVDRFRNGEVAGWAFDEETKSFELAITIYINGRVAGSILPVERRRDLDALAGPGLERGRGFEHPLPLGYFDGIGQGAKTITAVVAGRNIRLRRTPFKVGREARLYWHDDAGRWRGTPPERTLGRSVMRRLKRKLGG